MNDNDPDANCADPSGCAEVLAELEIYLDGEMEPDRILTFRTHIVECPPCADRADFHDRIRAMVRSSCAESAPPSLLDRISARLDELA